MKGMRIQSYMPASSSLAPFALGKEWRQDTSLGVVTEITRGGRRVLVSFAGGQTVEVTESPGDLVACQNPESPANIEDEGLENERDDCILRRT